MEKVQYGKIVDEVLEMAPKIAVYEDGTQQIPPPESWLKEAGYKPLEHTAIPDPQENYAYSFAWEDKGDKIVQVWSEEYIEPKYSVEERLEILEAATMEIAEMLSEVSNG